MFCTGISKYSSLSGMLASYCFGSAYHLRDGTMVRATRALTL